MYTYLVQHSPRKKGKKVEAFRRLPQRQMASSHTPPARTPCPLCSEVSLVFARKPAYPPHAPLDYVFVVSLRFLQFFTLPNLSAPVRYAHLVWLLNCRYLM